MKLKNTIIAGTIGLAGLIAAEANAKPNCEKRYDNDQLCIAREEARTIIYHKCHKDSYLLCTIDVIEPNKQTEYADLGCTGKATSIVITSENGTEMKSRTDELKNFFTKTIDSEYKKLKTIAKGGKQ